jgi:hypothetical protein
MKISFAALDRIPLSTKPRNPTANANENADRGTPGAVAGYAWPGPGAHATAAGSPICVVTGPDVRFASSCVVMSRSFAMTACLDLDLVAGTRRSRIPLRQPK